MEARLEEICSNPMIAMRIHKAVTPERIFQKRVSGLTQAHCHSSKARFPLLTNVHRCYLLLTLICEERVSANVSL